MGVSEGSERVEVKYRKLGRSGLKISPICLGTMMFGGASDEPESRRIIAAARDAGINFIDTADAYNKGRSEEVVGRATGPDDNIWFLPTRFAIRWARAQTKRGCRVIGSWTRPKIV